MRDLGDAGLQLWDAWSRKSPKYREGACDEKWRTFKGRGNNLGLGSLGFWAGQDQLGKADPPNGDDNIRRGKTRSISDFLGDRVVANWVCEPILARKAIGFVAGLPKTMKTWALIDMAVECARESGKWLGLFPVRRAKVLYIDQERFEGETQRRFAGAMAHKGLSADDLKDHLFVHCSSSTGVSIKLDDDASYAAFRRELDGTRPDVVIVDSFVTFHSSDENNRTAIQHVLERVKALRNEFGCAFIFVDHENKAAYQDEREGEAPSALRMAGSVGKLAAAEFVLTVRRKDHYSSTFHHTASTLGPTAAPFDVRVEDREGGGIAVAGSR